VTAAPSTHPPPDLPPDLVDAVLGLEPGSPVHALRRRRPEALRHAEGAFRELLFPADPGGVGRPERAALALRAALREGDAALAARYRALLGEADRALRDAAECLDGEDGEGRLGVLLRHADRVAARPEACDRDAIAALGAVGLDARDVVAVTQLASFVPYQVRLIAGLRAMMGESR